MRRYSITTTYRHAEGRKYLAVWSIHDHGDKGYSLSDDPVVSSMTTLVDLDDDADDDGHYYPAAVRAEYERLCGRGEFVDAADDDRPPNVVEFLTADSDDCAWDQACLYGHRVEGHAVYCHNRYWLYAPGKCRRNRTDFRHEKCPGFKPNPIWPGDAPPPPDEPES